MLSAPVQQVKNELDRATYLAAEIEHLSPEEIVILREQLKKLMDALNDAS